METNNTPLPWVIENRPSNVTTISLYGENDTAICLMHGTAEEQKANAEYIVKSCNNYPVLKQQNEELIATLKDLYEKLVDYEVEIQDKDYSKASNVIYNKRIQILELLTKYEKK